MEPILSICIPTYNRCDALRQSLERYVICEGFDDSVEIVISDNASTDDTALVVKDFCNKFANIKYYRNGKNIKDSNFELALKRGTGKYLKLQNDTTLFELNAIEYIKRCINSSNGSIPIFFTNDFIFTSYKKEKRIECESFDKFVEVLSTYITAISCFGVWKSQLDDIIDFTKYSVLMLNQDDWSYQLLEKYGRCVLYNEHYYDGLPKKFEGYHWFQVHLDNYYKIMQPYVDKGLIKQLTVERDKKNLIRHFLPELKLIYVYPVSNWKFKKKGTLRLFYKYYKNEWYFYLLLLMYPLIFTVFFPIHYAKAIIKGMVRKLKNVKR